MNDFDVSQKHYDPDLVEAAVVNRYTTGLFFIQLSVFPLIRLLRCNSFEACFTCFLQSRLHNIVLSLSEELHFVLTFSLFLLAALYWAIITISTMGEQNSVALARSWQYNLARSNEL